MTLGLFSYGGVRGFLLTRPHGTWQLRYWSQILCIGFLLTRPHGTWHAYFRIESDNCSEFLLTRPHGTWRQGRTGSTALWNFYSHVHTGRDGCSLESPFSQRHFYSHVHTGRDTLWITPIYRYGHFYSHVHTGRDFQLSRSVSVNLISTHTSTRDVTKALGNVNKNVKFLLTRPHGTWQDRIRCFLLIMVFLLTRPHGTWRKLSSFPESYNRFLLTRPHGTWQDNQTDDPDYTDFYSHVHTGRDNLVPTWPTFVRISTHTSTRDVTGSLLYVFKLSNDFYSHVHTGRDKNPVWRQ